jgi:hypothetical protein
MWADTLQSRSTHQITRRKNATATAVQTKQRPWWLTLILGISAIVVGALAWGTGHDRTYFLIECWASGG